MQALGIGKDAGARTEYRRPALRGPGTQRIVNDEGRSVSCESVNDTSVRELLLALARLRLGDDLVDRVYGGG